MQGEGAVRCAIAFVSFLILVSLTGRCSEPAGRSEDVVPAATSAMTDAAAGSGLQLQPSERPARGEGAGAVVVVAVRAAAREISKTAAVWALTHVVQHGDSILLLVLIPPRTSGMCMQCIFTPCSSVFHSYCNNCSVTTSVFQALQYKCLLLTHKQYHSAINLSVSMAWMYVHK